VLKPIEIKVKKETGKWQTKSKGETETEQKIAKKKKKIDFSANKNGKKIMLGLYRLLLLKSQFPKIRGLHIKVYDHIYDDGTCDII